MKAAEVYRLLREQLGPWAKREGFKRGDWLLSWYRPCAENYLVFWVQIDNIGWDAYRGNSFNLAFQFDREPQPAVAVFGNRAWMSRLLDPITLEQAREIQNDVIRSLPRPPKGFPHLMSPSDREMYVREFFEPVMQPYRPEGRDVWFRYYTEEHVRRWAEFVLEQLPVCVSKAEGWADELRRPRS